MTLRPKPEILDEIVAERGKHATLGRKMRASKESNWLLALILHAFAKVEAGQPLTDLDKALTKPFADRGLGGQLREHARLFTQMPTDTRRSMFPGAFADLDATTDYTFADLERELPTVQAAILAMPTSTDIDVVGVHQGRVAKASARRPRPSVVAAAGGELLRAVAPDDAPPDTLADPFSIKATSFHCTDETGTDWIGSDEAYWIFGSMGGGVTVTTKSQVFEDVDSGDDRTFGDTEGWIWGLDGQPGPLPEGEIAALVSLWEHDDGDPKDVQDATAAAFAAAAAVLAVSGVASWVAAVVAGVGGVVRWLLGFLDDDHIADQTFVFSRQTIIDQIGKIGQSFLVTRRFTDGDGDYTLSLQVSHLAAPPPPTPVTVPDVVGDSKATAVHRVQAAGLTPQVTVVSSPLLVPVGPGGPGGPGGPDGPPLQFFVVSQSPAGGATVDRGSAVRIRVSRLDDR